MDQNNIKELIKIMEDSDLNLLEIKDGEFMIRMERGNKTNNPAPVPAEGKQETKAEVAAQPQRMIDEVVVDLNNVSVICSPMVGVFYAQPKPGAPPFVKIGDKVKKGQVVCIIEAMKLMNEILAETDGEIVDICVEDGTLVEYGQVLFKVY
jgi:acetyl-CoA carboxylase biotin carboxyl carrier protein